jgi:hypothetical protein
MLADLPRELAGRRPDPTSWSVAECLAHLTLTTDAYVPAIREALADGRRQNLLSSRQSFRMELPARLLAWWLEPPYRLKSRTPAAFVPASSDPTEALPEFLQRQQRLFPLLAEANGLAIDRLRIASPFARQIRYSVYSAFRLIAVHQRRHLWQAEQVARSVTAVGDAQDT